MAYFSDPQAKDIWKARWLGEGVQALVERYRQSPFRFYEVWTEERNQGTRLKAFDEFKREHPDKAAIVDASPHKPKRRVTTRTIVNDGQHELLL
ncbi:hypothetical protein GCM10007923_19080 [Shinella yambaruensis]|uniref:Uncharacterized protein n=2 Tax=Shinella yambaruensis TaxID=415996 RepID=A0ABQ5ZF96_9HYPH|nr:hypothetical protein GCM10007923_19080 [Shinella yambaruensis]